MNATVLLVLSTGLLSIIGFRDPRFFGKWLFNPFQIYHRKEWYRQLSHGFLHADWVHLIINMLVLWSFGQAVEQNFSTLVPYPEWLFLGFYLVAVPISSIPTLLKQKENYHYQAVGASGAVSAVLFASIFFDPLGKVYLYGLIGIPGILMGIAYLFYSGYMARKGGDNINHDAHFYGAVFGFFFPLILKPALILSFLEKLTDF